MSKIYKGVWIIFRIGSHQVVHMHPVRCWRQELARTLQDLHSSGEGVTTAGRKTFYGPCQASPSMIS